jgi:uncharacterized membrane protein
MLVSLPIGLFIFSLASDIIFRAGWGPPVWADVAYLSMAGGIVGALLAAVPGFIDFLSIARRRRTTQGRRKFRIGLSHMILNLTVVALYAGNLYLRGFAAPDDPAPLWLSVLGVGLLGVSGFLGGTLVFEERVGVVEQVAHPVESPRYEAPQGIPPMPRRAG